MRNRWGFAIRVSAMLGIIDAFLYCVIFFVLRTEYTEIILPHERCNFGLPMFDLPRAAIDILENLY